MDGMFDNFLQHQAIRQEVAELSYVGLNNKMCDRHVLPSGTNWKDQRGDCKVSVRKFDCENMTYKSLRNNCCEKP